MALSKDDLGHFRTRLEQRRDEAMSRGVLEQLQAEQETPIDQINDVGDRSVNDLERDTALTHTQRSTHERDEVEGALLRLDRGEYGLCEECGEAIDRRRLEVLPEARTCVPCARAAEAGQPRHATL